MKRKDLILAIAAPLALLGLFLIPSVLSAQAAGETFTATATIQFGGKSAAEPVRIVINQYMTEAERVAVVDALKKGGTPAAKQVLDKMKDLGTIEVLGRTTPVKFAFARETGTGGRIITLVTAQPIHYVKAGNPADKAKAGYEVGLTFLFLDANGSGDGEMAPAAKIRMDDSGAIVVDDYGGAKVWLKDVAKAK